MVSPYRAADVDVMTSGASAMNWYSANLCANLSELGEAVCVIAPKGDGENRAWTDGAVVVHPAYRRGSPFFAWDVVRAAVRLRAAIVHVQFELFAFGGVAQAISVPLALAFLRLLGKTTVSTFHGLPSSRDLTPAFLERNGIRLPKEVVALCLRVLGAALAISSTRLIVHQDSQRRMIAREYGAKDASVIPIGVDVREAPPKDVGRARYGIPMDAVVVLFFGYFAPYKGLEELVPAVKRWIDEDPAHVFVFAGSTPPRYSGRRSDTLDADLVARTQIVTTGFVPDEDVPVLFGAVDALILPYTINMAASGPMNIALGYGVPVLMSSVFAEDYGAAQSFEPNRTGILDALRAFSRDERCRLRLRGEALRMRSSRSWREAAGKTIAVYGARGAR
jgi:glycosyltransferase involved in cell wall biosynthesis